MYEREKEYVCIYVCLCVCVCVIVCVCVRERERERARENLRMKKNPIFTLVLIWPGQAVYYSRIICIEIYRWPIDELNSLRNREVKKRGWVSQTDF